MVISTSLVVVNGTQSALLVRGMTDENRRSLKYFVSTELLISTPCVSFSFKVGIRHVFATQL